MTQIQTQGREYYRQASKYSQDVYNHPTVSLNYNKSNFYNDYNLRLSTIFEMMIIYTFVALLTI